MLSIVSAKIMEFPTKRGISQGISVCLNYNTAGVPFIRLHRVPVAWTLTRNLASTEPQVAVTALLDVVLAGDIFVSHPVPIISKAPQGNEN